MLNPSDLFDKLYVQKTELEKYIEYWYIKNLNGFKGLLLIIEVKINFSLGFDNTGYQTNCKVYINIWFYPFEYPVKPWEPGNREPG